MVTVPFTEKAWCWLLIKDILSILQKTLSFKCTKDFYAGWNNRKSTLRRLGRDQLRNRLHKERWKPRKTVFRSQLIFSIWQQIGEHVYFATQALEWNAANPIKSSQLIRISFAKKNIISEKYFWTAVCDVLYDNAIVQKA
jgi:hypothetical protein